VERCTNFMIGEKAKEAGVQTGGKPYGKAERKIQKPVSVNER